MKKTIVIALFFLCVMPVNAQILIPAVNKKGMYGYVDRNNKKKFIVKAKYDHTFPIVNGYGRIVSNGLHGFVDDTGKVVIPPEYSSATDFQQNLAICSKNGYYGIIKSSNDIYLEFNYIYIEKNATYFKAKKADGSIDIVQIPDAVLHTYSSLEETAIWYFAKNAGGEYIIDKKNGKEAYIQIENSPLTSYRVYQSIGKDPNYAIVYSISAADTLMPQKIRTDYLIQEDHYTSLSDIKDDGSRLVVDKKGANQLIDKDGKVLLNNCQEVNGYYIAHNDSTHGMLYEKNGTTVIYEGKIKEVVGNTIYFYDETQQHVLCFDTDARMAGIRTEGKDVLVCPLSSSIELLSMGTSDAILICRDDNQSVSVFDIDGKQMWNDLQINDVSLLNLSDVESQFYFAISEKGDNHYRLSSSDGSLYPTVFKTLNKYECVLLDGNGGEINGKPRIIEGRAIIEGDEFNYNTYTWYYDIEKKLYGKIDENEEIIATAYSKTKLVPPLGKAFLREINIWHKQPHKPFEGWQITSQRTTESDAFFCFEYYPIKYSEKSMILYMSLRGNKLYFTSDGTYMGTLAMDSKGNLTITNQSGIASYGNYNFAGKYVLSDYE